MRGRALLLVVAVMAVAAVAILVYGVFITRQGTESVPVRIAYMKVDAALPMFVAYERGFLQKRGLQPEMTLLAASTQLVEALVAGRADAAAGLAVQTGLSAWVSAPGSFRILGMTQFTEKQSTGCVLAKKDSPINSFQDLAGKKVGGIPSTFHPLVLEIVAEQHGMPAKSIQYVGMAPDLHLQALQAGTVDALYAFRGTCAQGEKMGIGKAILRGQTIRVLNPMPSVLTAVSTSFEKAQPRGAKAVEDALNDALEDMKKNPEEGKRILAQYTGEETDMVDLVLWTGYLRWQDVNPKHVQAFADLLYQRGLLTKPVEAAALLRKP